MKVELTEKTVCAGREVELIKITEDVKETVKSSRVKDGVVFIISAHTTAGITMNEGLPCVEKDLIDKLDKMVPCDDIYAHAHFLPSYGATGGNSPGHIKSMLAGNGGQPLCTSREGRKYGSGTCTGYLFCRI